MLKYQIENIEVGEVGENKMRTRKGTSLTPFLFTYSFSIREALEVHKPGKSRNYGDIPIAVYPHCSIVLSRNQSHIMNFISSYATGVPGTAYKSYTSDLNSGTTGVMGIH